MQFKLGNGSVDLWPVEERMPHDTFAHLYDIKWQRIYQWWCDVQFGMPSPRPEKIKLRASIDMRKSDRIDPAGLPGYWNSPEGQAWEWNRLFNVLGLNGRAEIQTELDKRFPPVDADVPYNSLIEPNAASESRDLYVLELYLRWTFYADPALAQGAPAPFVLRIPYGIQFTTSVTSVCEGEPLDAFQGFKRGGGGKTPVSKEMFEMAREYNKAMRERRKKMRTWETPPKEDRERSEREE